MASNTAANSNRPRSIDGSFNIDDSDRPRWNVKTTPVAVYDYHDERGRYRYQIERGMNEDGSKVFRIRRANTIPLSDRVNPEDRDEYFSGLGEEKHILYRLSELNAADPGALVFIGEGEQACDRLSELGLVSTTSPCGALKWKPDYARWLAGRHLVILPDNDRRGQQHGEQVLESVYGIAASVRVLNLPGLPPKGDVADWLNAGHTKQELLALVEAQPLAARPLPKIKIVPGELARMADEAEAALIAAELPFYVCGGSLVRVVVDSAQAGVANDNSPATPSTIRVTLEMMLDYLSRSAIWLRWNMKKNDWVAADPSTDAIKVLLSRQGELRFPRLKAVLTTPTLRPDGSILSAPGYDAATGILLVHPPALPAIADKPTKEDAEAALALLEGVLADFPFDDGASRSVALSALISPVVRGALPQMPLHAVRAPMPGSGKSYLIDLAAAIAIGQRAPVLASGRGEETEKRLCAVLLRNPVLISIDNVNGKLEGDVLCQLIERPVVEVRPLGKSDMITIESRCSVFTTGNNIVLTGDMNRRTVVCSLDANAERPELRAFSGNPFKTILKSRGDYIAAAMTVVRAYAEAGYPEVLKDLASFEPWSRNVRSALVWLGRADPCETMNKNRDNDPGLDDLRTLLGQWEQTIGTDTKNTTADVKALATTAQDTVPMLAFPLFDALMAVAASKSGPVIDAHRLGTYLGKNEGRIVDGLKIASERDSHLGVKVWSVIRVEDAA